MVRRQTTTILEYQGEEQPVSMDAFRLKSLNLSYKALLAQELKGQVGRAPARRGAGRCGRASC